MARQEDTTKQEDTKKALPVKKVRVGGASLDAWENTGEYGKYLTVSVTRSYKDKESNWQTTNSFAKNDLNDLAIAIAEMQRFMNLEWPATQRQDKA